MQLGPIKVASWRTTALGVVSLLLIAGRAVAIPLLDDDPETLPNFRLLLEAAIDWSPVIAVGLGLMVSRDNKVSSQEVGIRNEPPPVPRMTADAIARSQQQ